jgi:hypothetical protein
MKASNKWLLGFLVVAFGFSLAVYGVLYGQYRKGNFIRASQLHDERFIHESIAPSRILAIDGAIWVNLIPADSFAIEMPRINKDPDDGLFVDQPRIRVKKIGGDNMAVTWRQNGDTLFLTGNIHNPIHRAFSNFYYRRDLPQVNILSPRLGEVWLDNAQVYLQGGPDATRNGSARINVRNSTLWIGMQYDNHRQDPHEYFDSIDIEAANSNILLNAPATIHRLQATLTDSSWLSDQYATLDSAIIRTDPASVGQLTGANLKRTRLITH